MDRDALALVALNTLMLDPWKAQAAVLRFGGPARLLATDPARLVDWLPPAALAAFRGAEPAGHVEIAAAAGLGVSVLTAADARMPARVAELASVRGAGAPLALYGQGDLRALELPAVALVGARRATPYGSEVARALAFELAGRGVAVVSGLARGIDGCAHRGALQARGVTIAVLGSGLRRVYPPEHRQLFAEVVATGLALSELPLEAPPLPYNFPRRNRLIAAVADVVVVVEAAENSGSRHTADAALALGRVVMAVPGPVTSPLSRGTNGLIRDGALVASGVEDVLLALSTSPRWVGRAGAVAAPSPDPEPAPSGLAAVLLSALSVEEPRHLDEVAQAVSVPLPDLLATLQELCSAGLVKQLPGQLFQRSARMSGNGRS